MHMICCVVALNKAFACMQTCSQLVACQHMCLRKVELVFDKAAAATLRHSATLVACIWSLVLAAIASQPTAALLRALV